MKKLFKLLFLLPLIGGVFAFASNSNEKKEAIVSEVKADSIRPYPYSGGETSIIFVSGGVFGETAHAAIYVWNNIGSAWSNKVDYTVDGAYPVVLPPTNGQSWSKFIVARYNPALEPSVNGWDGAYNKTDDLQMSIFSARSQNTIYITGYDGNTLTVSDQLNVKYFYGVKGDTHFYLDLKDCSNWREANAKYAIYFAHSNNIYKKEDWSLSNSEGGYYLSFMWKVAGQDNENLYECIVPGGSATLWNLVIAVRFNPVQGEPGWYNVWNQTADITFNSSNHEANMIYIDSSGNGSINPDHKISKDTRLNFYGQYLLDTVECSGTGESDATTSGQWNAIKAEYKNHLSTTFQGGVWSATADKAGSTLAQAIYRYDYIVFYKHYDHEDFINRADPNSGYVPISSGLAFGIESYADAKKSSIYIVIISVASISVLGLLIVLKRKKSLR